MTNKVIVKDSFIMPAVGETTELLLRECADLVPYCWIWNKSVGYLEVTKYSGYDIYVTVKNPGLEENAVSGTVFPTCMEFLITSPKATPIIDSTVTCLKADFKSPEVGQEALMSVQSSSAMRVGDIIVVGTRYQYLVTEIINEFTIKVLNEEKGAEGVINIECDECVPVKIMESTHCCEALQDQVDDIYNRIDNKKSIATYVGSLVAITNGLDSLTDVANNVYIDVNPDLSYYDNSVSQFITLGDVPRGTLSSNETLLTVTNGTNNVLDNISLSLDTDLSKYDNTTSAFITLEDIPALPSDTDLSHYDNSTSGFITSASLPTVNDAKLTIYESDGVTPFVEFTANASSAVTATLPAMTTVNDATLTIYESDGVTPFVTFTANAASNVTATLPSSGSSLVYFEESYDSGTDTATFKPKYSTANSFNIGRFFNVYAQRYSYSATTHSYIWFSSADGGSTIINNGTSGTYGTDYNNIIIELGNSDRLHINDQDITTYVDILPDTDNSYDLGSSSKAFADGYINNTISNTVTTDNYKNNLNYTNPTTPFTNLNFGSTYYYDNGTNNEMSILNIQSVYDGSTNTITEILPQKTNTSKSHFCSLGSSTSSFSQTYTTNLHTNNIYVLSGNTMYLQSNLRDSGGGVHNLGSNDNYFAGVYAGGFVTRPSDIREKENVENYKNSVLDKLDKLNPMTYTIKGSKDGEVKFGLSAQELQEIEPLCVVGSETKSDEKLGIELYATLTLAMQAIKELSAKVKDLESKLGEKDANNEVAQK